MTVKQSDLFNNVNENFDLIVFNAPFFQGKARREDQQNWLNNDFKIIENFLKQADAHLIEGGIILMTYSSIANSMFQQTLNKQGYSFKIVAQKSIIVETFKIYSLQKNVS